MGELKDQMIRLIQYDSEKQVAKLAGEFARAPSEEKEGILAELEFERWMADTCAFCLNTD
ncbi:hypothetical protein ACFL3F_05200 [Planctomycetota bacterium]